MKSAYISRKPKPKARSNLGLTFNSDSTHNGEWLVWISGHVAGNSELIPPDCPDKRPVLSGQVNFPVVGYRWPGNAIHAHKRRRPLKGSPQRFQYNFGPVQERDKWRASSQAALRVLYCAPSNQTVGRAGIIKRKRRRLLLRCPLSAQNIPF